MKSNTKKKLAVLLCIALAMGCLAACGEKPQESGGQDSKEESASVSASGEKPQESGGQEPEESAPVSFSIMISAPVEFAPDGNAWVEEVNRLANADITWIAYPASNFEEKRSATMAGSDYPDVIILNTGSGMVGDSLYDSMRENDIILPLDEYLTEDIAPNILKYTHEAAWDAIKESDGRTYCIPR